MGYKRSCKRTVTFPHPSCATRAHETYPLSHPLHLQKHNYTDKRKVYSLWHLKFFATFIPIPNKSTCQELIFAPTYCKEVSFFAIFTLLEISGVLTQTKTKGMENPFSPSRVRSKRGKTTTTSTIMKELLISSPDERIFIFMPPEQSIPITHFGHLHNLELF